MRQATCSFDQLFLLRLRGKRSFFRIEQAYHQNKGAASSPIHVRGPVRETLVISNRTLSSASVEIRSQAKLGIVAASLFLLLICGANVPNPMLPMYVDSLALAPFEQSALFSSYVGAMVIVLAFLSRLSPGHTVWVLAAAGLLMIAADGAMVLADGGVQWVFLGRVLSGCGVGFGTGAASALVLRALGERGRTVVASGSVTGSLLGNLGAGAVATYMPNPAVVAYLGHGLITLSSLVALLVLWTRGRGFTGHYSQDSEPGVVAGANRGPNYGVRHRIAGYLLGGLAWTVAGAVLALTPSAVRLLDHSATLLAAIGPGCVLLACGSIAQAVTARQILRLRAWHVVIPMLLGTWLAAHSLADRSYLGLLLACAVIGMGQGPGYTLGLATITHGRPPSLQGKTTSSYALAAYGACATAVVTIGAVASERGLASALYLTTATFAVVGGVAVFAAGRPQKLSHRDGGDFDHR